MKNGDNVSWVDSGQKKRGAILQINGETATIGSAVWGHWTNIPLSSLTKLPVGLLR
jgi:hypothetical protein